MLMYTFEVSNVWQRNWVFATNSDFLIPIFLEPNFADLWYFKLWILLDQIIWVWNIKGLQHRVLKILWFKYLILFQRLNSFIINLSFVYLYVRSACTLAGHHVAIIIKGSSNITITWFTSIDIVRKAKVLWTALITVPTNHIPLTLAFSYRVTINKYMIYTIYIY